MVQLELNVAQIFGQLTTIAPVSEAPSDAFLKCIGTPDAPATSELSEDAPPESPDLPEIPDVVLIVPQIAMRRVEQIEKGAPDRPARPLFVDNNDVPATEAKVSLEGLVAEGPNADCAFDDRAKGEAISSGKTDATPHSATLTPSSHQPPHEDLLPQDIGARPDDVGRQILEKPGTPIEPEFVPRQPAETPLQNEPTFAPSLPCDNTPEVEQSLAPPPKPKAAKTEVVAALVPQFHFEPHEVADAKSPTHIQSFPADDGRGAANKLRTQTEIRNQPQAQEATLEPLPTERPENGERVASSGPVDGAVKEGQTLSGISELATHGPVVEVARVDALSGPERTAEPPRVVTENAARIVEVAKQLPDRPVEITLSPEELGRVRITVELAKDDSVHVVIHAERTEAADLIKRNIHVLQADFRDVGYERTSFSFSGDGGRRPQTVRDSFADDRDEPMDITAHRIAEPARIRLDTARESVDIRL